MKKYRNISLFCISLTWLSLSAEITLPQYFSDNMVVQRESELKIIGKSSRPGSKVTVTPGWEKKEYSAVADPSGEFSIMIKTPKAGGPYTLTLSDGDKMTLNNVLSGEVWICSGQSNMEMPIKGWGHVMNWEEEIKNSDHPLIRLLKVKRTTAPAPVDPLDLQLEGNGWAVCGPESVEDFSAVAYFYARELASKLNIPIGVINTSWGGTPAESWTSLPVLQNVLDMDDYAGSIAACDGDIERLRQKYEVDLRNWRELLNSKDPGMDGSKAAWASTFHDNWPKMSFPGTIEQQGLADYDGSVWVQRLVNIPASWVGKDLTITLGGIDDDDITYFNGEEVGHCEGVIFKRTYNIPASLVKEGEALVTVRIQDNGGLGGINGEASDLALICGDERIPLAGEWHYNKGVSLSELPPRSETPDSPYLPGNLYHAMISPLTKFPMRGVIWYQGESNVLRWEQYTPLFQAMITNWRDDWGEEFPFYFVQLANFMPRQDVQPQSDWAHLREAQANALQLKNTGMAPAIEIGEELDIHPKNKQEVGRRLAQLALADTYGKGRYELPVMKRMIVSGREAVLEMSMPLKVNGDKATGFVICGSDMKFYPADATVEGNKITVTSPNVKHPVAVRYGWADNPACNIYTIDELPLPPFRTDRFR